MAFCRIIKDIGIKHPQNLSYHDLRGFSPAERLKMIDFAIMRSDDLLLVVIDGIRDLLTHGINDETEATSITSSILKWCAFKQIHIILVLHQNKTDFNARGHIGTELVNKAEITLTVTKEKDPAISTVKTEFARGRETPSFSFYEDDEDLPRLTDYNCPAATKKRDEEVTKFTWIFKEQSRMSYTLLVNKYMDASGLKESGAKKHISAALVSGMLLKDDQGYYSCSILKDEEHEPF
ncbi:MAG: hypothetical protein EOM59_16220 [Clostridia bacterium]|nr:hypothetical protein [Clostridia bacterium]